MVNQSAYEILNLEGDFTVKDIKKSYRKMILKYPPEHYPKEFAIVRDAYDKLTNEHYFEKSVETGKLPLYALDIKIENSKKISDISKYLNEIFEIPFDLEKVLT
jgi:DnaJ-class molecular chaperone